MKLAKFIHKHHPSVFPLAAVLTAGVALGACHQVNGKWFSMKDVSVVLNEMVAGATISDENKNLQSAYAAQVSISPTPEKLADYQWTLSQVTQQDAPLQAFTPMIQQQSAQMRIMPGEADSDQVMLDYTLGCSHYTVPAVLVADELSLNQTELTGTKNTCADGFSHEIKFAKQLDGSTLSLTTNPLDYTAELIQTKGALHIVWTGVLTREARYGQPAQLYWEVDASKRACATKDGQQDSCLRVRNVKFDETGTRTGAGAWRTFYGDIQGYQHSNQQQIIRIHAYNNPNSDQKTLFVFDGVVGTKKLQQL